MLPGEHVTVISHWYHGSNPFPMKADPAGARARAEYLGQSTIRLTVLFMIVFSLLQYARYGDVPERSFMGPLVIPSVGWFFVWMVLEHLVVMLEWSRIFLR